MGGEGQLDRLDLKAHSMKLEKLTDMESIQFLVICPLLTEAPYLVAPPPPSPNHSTAS